MSRRTYAMMIAALTCACGLAFFAALPSRHELGWLDELSCRTWFSTRGVSGAVRLTDCVVDAREPAIVLASDGRWVQEVRVAIRPSSHGGASVEGATGLEWRTADPRLRALADRMRELDGEARARFIERHRGELVFVSDLAVRGIEPAEQAFVADGRVSPRWIRVFGAATLPFPLLALLALVVAQRGWQRRRRAIERGSAEPVSF